jgi:hypothetical protein
METNSNEPPKPRGNSAIALFLGFTPAAILIALVSGLGGNISGSQQQTFLWLGCAVSIVCCFVSSAMLFRRGAGGAIAGAVLLMLLNGFIAFFFGCCASLNFH